MLSLQRNVNRLGCFLCVREGCCGHKDLEFGELDRINKMALKQNLRILFSEEMEEREAS